MAKRCTLCLQEVECLVGVFNLTEDGVFLYHPKAAGHTLWPGNSFQVDACEAFTIDAIRMYLWQTVYVDDA